MARTPTAHPRQARRLASRLLTALVLTGVVAWAVLLRPTFLGGDTTYTIVSGTSMLPALRGGDLVVARRASDYRVGDVVVYGARPEGAVTDKLIVHRIVGGSAADGYVLRGDNREREDVWRPRPDDVRGRQVLRVPLVGSVLARLQQPRLLTAAIAGVLVFLLVTAVGAPAAGRRRRDATPGPVPAPGWVETVAAVAAEDAAGRPPGYLVLARAADGYALVERDGEPPAPGGLLVLDGRLFEVAGAALSPLPSDPRLCVLAERLAKAPV